MGGTDHTTQGEWSATQRELWEREEAFWEFADAGAVDRFMALWHDEFVGWPDSEEAPVPLSDHRPVLGDWLEETSSSEFRYTLEPQAVTLSEDVGITYYRVRTDGPADAGEEAAVYRMTHTWKDKGGEWKILGGMSVPTKRP